MGRLIDADELKDEIEEWLDCVGNVVIGKSLSYYAELQGCIDDCPTVDAEPVRHGKWVHLGDGFIECSWCKASVYNDDIYRASIFGEVKNPAEYDVNPYCPNCGARMDAE